MADVQEQKKIATDAILQLYERVLGKTTAKVYYDFYNDKDLDTILLSAHELLEEFLGKTKADEELKQIYSQANLPQKS